MPAHPRSYAAHLFAAAVYLALSLWTLRSVLPAPASTVPYPADLEGHRWQTIIESDQRLVLAQTARNAWKFATAKRGLFESGDCYPTQNAVALGEHAFGIGLAGLIPWLISGDPILTYNTVLLLYPVIAALSTYALVYS